MPCRIHRGDLKIEVADGEEAIRGVGGYPALEQENKK